MVNRLDNPLAKVVFEERPAVRGKEEEIFSWANEGLNESQKEAVRLCLAAPELGLIHGPPGTGKTTTVVELVVQLARRGQRVLVAAPSNVAVDNIAEKLMKVQEKLQISRIGHPARFLEKIQNVALETQVEASPMNKAIKQTRRDLDKVLKQLSREKEKDKRNEIKDKVTLLRKEIKSFQKEIHNSVLKESTVLLATCVGSGDKKLAKFLKDKRFDCVVIDECAQATEASCFIPLFQGKKVVLAGDHLQLPPTIKSEKAAKEGLSTTLFDRMMRFNPECSVMLNIQYRMNEVIMGFSSQEFYNNKLKAAESVKDRLMTDLYPVDEDGFFKEKILFVDLTNMQMYESEEEESGSKLNKGESKVVGAILARLKVNPEEMGVIAPYRAQVTLLREERVSTEEISTVDGFQGREKEIIVLSCTRSNDIGEVGFLRESRRMNVAITRPKRLLIVVGNFSTIEQDPFLARLVKYVESNGRKLDVYELFDHGQIQEMQTVPVKAKKQVEKSKPKPKTKKQPKKPADQPKIESEKPKIREEPREEQPIEVDNTRVDKVKADIQAFMDNPKLKVKLIPGLDSRERRLIHEFCSEFGISHNSQGEGDKRTIVLKKEKPKEPVIQPKKKEIKPKPEKKVVQTGCPFNNCGAPLCDHTCGICSLSYCLDHISNWGHKCFASAPISQEKKADLKSKMHAKVNQLQNSRKRKGKRK